MQAEITPSSKMFKALIALALIVLLSGGAWFYRLQEQAMHRKVEEDLSAIAQLKVTQIAAWRKDQIQDAATMQEHPFLRQSVEHFLANPGEENRTNLSIRLRTLAKQHDYSDALLVDSQGEIKLSMVESATHYGGNVTSLIEAMHGCLPVIEDLHVHELHGAPHISVIVPICSSATDGQRPVGALVLVNEASRFLYPLIQFWPTPSDSAETLLVRRDGDHVLFLNDLRHQSDTALKLRIPLTETTVPAVMAIEGKVGYAKGMDYRGIEVVSIIAPIPDSPWFMISKIDSDEVFAEWHFRSALIVALLLGLSACLGTAGLVLWQRDKKAHFRALYLSEAALRAEAERHSVTLQSIGDAVIATDAEGFVELLNPVAEELTGWQQDQARGRPLTEIFRIVNEETREPVEDPVTKVLREGMVVGLANHTILIARDGSERPIADSGAPIRGRDGAITGVVLVFRDQSEERAAGEALLASERRYRETLDGMLEGCQIIGPDWRYLYVNRTAARHGRKKPEELLGRSMLEIYPEIDNTPLVEVMKQCLEHRRPHRLENEFRYPDGSSGYFDLSIEPVPEGIFILSVDITERRLTQQALFKSTERTRHLADIIDKAQQPLAVGYPDGRLGTFNEAFCRLTGYSAEELASLDWINTLTPLAWHRVEAEALAELDRTGEPIRFQKEYRRKDGSLVPIELLVHAVKGEDGTPLYYYA
ncbi:MAG: PAS domain S-box protein, partial [Desulfofustis sp.]|nr:PAS domain S-box protein [Desulfofustis sp.]